MKIGESQGVSTTSHLSSEVISQLQHMSAAAFEVYRVRGSGFPTEVYRECLEIELGMREIPTQIKPTQTLSYKGHALVSKVTVDFICYDFIPIVVVVAEQITKEMVFTLENLLEAAKREVGLIVNFGAIAGLEHRRVVPKPRKRDVRIQLDSER
mgnify:CR=1 FL=1